MLICIAQSHFQRFGSATFPGALSTLIRLMAASICMQLRPNYSHAINGVFIAATGMAFCLFSFRILCQSLGDPGASRITERNIKPTNSEHALSNPPQSTINPYLIKITELIRLHNDTQSNSFHS